MNREQAKELLPIIQAFAEGKDVQFWFAPGRFWCTDKQNPEFDPKDKWRVKPEPREFWAVKPDTGHPHVVFSTIVPAKAAQSEWGGEIIHLIEVIE